MANNLSQKFYLFYLSGILLILVLPLLAIPPLFFPPCWAKVIVFRTILAVLLFILIIQFLYKKTRGLEIRKLNLKGINGLPLWLLVFLLFIYLLATIFSVEPYFSFWGSPFRSEGSLNFTFFIIFTILLFLLIKDKDWQKIWNFSIFIGLLVAIFGIFQYFKFFPGFLVSFESGSVPSTTGYSGFFGTYLLFLSFLSLSFGLKEVSKKKFFYFSCLPFFLLGTIISGARASYLGLIVGALYFLFFYPVRKTGFSNGVYPKKIKILKIVTGIVLILVVCAIFYVNFSPKLPEFIQKNRVFSYLASRSSLKIVWEDIEKIRWPAWKTGIKTIKEKPILGWGPENFGVGFDKYYDPSLPRMKDVWWDRAHNFLIEFSVNAGIPFLLAFLVLVGVLFWRLNTLKRAEQYAEERRNAIIAHGVQAAFLGYLTALFFTFDGFVTHLMFFLLVAYSLFLTQKTPPSVGDEIHRNTQKGTQIYTKHTNLYKSVFLSVLICVVLIGFIWYFNIKPLRINSQVFVADYFVRNQKCEQGLAKIEAVFPQKSIIDAYIRLKYLDFIKKCAPEGSGKDLEYATKGISAAKEAVKIQPTFTRAWLLLGGFTNILIAQEKNLQVKKELIKDAYSYFETAQKLSPKRPEIYVEWAKTDFLAENYQGMKEKVEKCLIFTKNMPECYWYLAISQIFLGDEENAKKNIETAKQKGLPARLSYLHQLERAYSATKNYRGLVGVYNGLIYYEPSNFQYHATLAFIYKELGDYESARNEALKVLELKGDDPEIRNEVELFLKTLPH